MGIIEKLKTLWFYMTVDPNSPKGLRFRADKLAKECLDGYQDPYVSALIKQADLKEERERSKK